MDEEEVGVPALANATGFRLAEDLARLPRHRRKRLPRLEPGLDERLHLRGEVIRDASIFAWGGRLNYHG